MSNSSVISVIITTYNRVEMLLLTLESVLKQTYTNIEVLVIDDGSNDLTEQKLKNIEDERVFYYKIDHWGGPARPRNIGIEKSTGDYICFCDDDDLWDKFKLEKSMDYITQNGAVFLFTDITFIDQFDNPIKKKYISRYLIPKIHILKKKSLILLANNMIPLSTVMIKKDIFKNIRFLEDKNLISQEDHYLWILINQNTQLHFLKSKLVQYRIHIGGISKNKDKRRVVFDYKINKLWKYKIINIWHFFLMKISFEIKEFLKK